MSIFSPPKFWLVVPAAGIGSRMERDKPKQYLQIHNKTILEHALSSFLSHPCFEKVYVGISENDQYFDEIGLNDRPDIEVFPGGNERAQTVLSGLEYLSQIAKDEDWVWVHDAARPCLSHEEIDLLIEGLRDDVAGLVLGVPISDTLKRVFPNKNVSENSTIKETVDRSCLWRAMTPQIFRYGELKTALESCLHNGLMVTDEASAIECIGKHPSMVQGSEQNIKVTLPGDLIKASQFLANKQNEPKLVLNSDTNPKQESLSMLQANILIPRIGSGFDVHAFGEGSFVTLGGVDIPYEQGLIAHSDGDVLLHAIMDAMLGALALGDIGKHFPDTDDKWKGANSRVLLKAVNALVKENGFKVGNLDSIIIAQAPKMSPFIETMQKNLAHDLEIDMGCVGVKATTTEKLGFPGRKEGIACQASVILMPLSLGNIE